MAALTDGAHRFGAAPTPVATAQDIADWARAHGLAQIALPYAPTGPVADTIAPLARIAPDLTITQIRSDWDSACWPHATHGFFRFKKHIPTMMDRLITR